MKNSHVIKGLILGGALFAASSANAALMRITPLGVGSDEQDVTSPVPIGSDGFRLSYHSNGNHGAITNPLILIIGVPTDSGGSPDVGDGAAQNPDSPVALNAVLGAPALEGVFDSSTGGNVYALAGLTPDGAGNSQNYSNWNGATGLTSWDIYTIEVTFTPEFGPGFWNEFTANFVEGTYVAGFGTYERQNGSRAGQQTPFTFAGLVTKVPEPAMLSLFGSALIGVGLFGRRRRSS